MTTLRYLTIALLLLTISRQPSELQRLAQSETTIVQACDQTELSQE